MSTRERGIRFSVLTTMAFLLGSWLLFAPAAFGQRRDDVVTVATQAAIDRASNSAALQLAALRGELDNVKNLATDARDEVREMRRAVLGMAGVILVNLIMQIAALKKSKGGA